MFLVGELIVTFRFGNDERHMKMRLLAALFVLVTALSTANAGTFYSFKAGDFSDRNNWSTTSSGAQSIPSSGAWGSNNGWDNVLIISHAMTLSGASYTQWGSSSSVTINNGGSLQRTGNLSLTGSGINITVNNGGAFDVTGTLTLDGTIISFASGSTNSTGALSLSNSGSSSLSNAGSLTVNGNVSMTGPFTNSGTVTVNGNYTQQNGGSSTTSSGTFTVTGTTSALGLIQLNPSASSSSTFTTNALTVNDNPWIVVGTNVSGCNTVITNYANLIVKTNITLTGSGDVTVNQTGRLVVFGNLTRSSGSGSLVTINCGGQAYVHGNINLGSGGGNTVTNNNNNPSTSPTGSNGSPVIGLYVNGTVTAQTTTGTVGSKADLQSNNSNFFTYIAGLSGSPLPVSLLFFKVLDQNTTSVQLAWATATELNFDYFLLERSSDGILFEETARLKGHGNSKQRRDYGFVDSQPVNGKLYYRLTSVDFDGHTETFEVVGTTFVSEKTISVSPNPVTDSRISIDLNFTPDTDSRMIITDLSGLVIGSHDVTGVHNEVNLNLNAGTYLFAFFSGEVKRVVRVVVK